MQRIIEIHNKQKKTTCGNKINWFKFRTILNLKAQPFNLFITSDDSDERLQVSLQKYGIDTYMFKSKKRTLLHSSSRPINKKKYIDLNFLSNTFMPENCRDFYKNLRYEHIDDDVDYGLAEISDEDDQI